MINPVVTNTNPSSMDQQTSAFKRIATTGYIFAFPATLLLCLVILIPSLVVFGLSFTNYSLGIQDWSFVGAGNYGNLLNDEVFLKSLKNTCIYVAIVVPSAVGLGLWLAILIQGRKRLRRFYEVAYFLPVTGTLVAMAIVWQFLLHSRIGPVNQWLSNAGYERIGFLTDSNSALITLAMIGVWQLVGFNMILFIAGLTAIPHDLYDAATLDGADSPLDRFFRITWPMLGPTTIFVLITTTITAFQVFDTVVVLTRGGPSGSTDVLLYQMYLEGFRYFQTGYAAALTVVFLTIILAISLLQLKFFDRRVHYQ